MRLFSREILMGGAATWRGFGTGKHGAVIISQHMNYTGMIEATHFILKAGVGITQQTRLQPVVIKATHSITLEPRSEIFAAGKGYSDDDAGFNYFGIAASSSNGNGPANAIGISGGGCKGWRFIKNDGQGGNPVPVNTFLPFIKNEANYRPVLEDNDYSHFPIFGGGGGWSNTGADYNFSLGGGAVILSAPKIILGNNCHISVIGYGGKGDNGGFSGGGGGGGWIGQFGNEFVNNGANLEATGGGGGGKVDGHGGWNPVTFGTPGQGGLCTPVGGYSTGGGGGGSTALNADGGIPGAGGQGTQFWGEAGQTTGKGGGAGNGGGSNRWGSSGSGGAAGKITWVQVNK